MSRLAPTIRSALEALAEGPVYLLSSRFFGRRGDVLTPGVPPSRNRRTPIPIVKARTAGQLIRAGLAVISRAGRLDRNASFMLSLMPAGREMLATLQ